MYTRYRTTCTRSSVQVVQRIAKYSSTYQGTSYFVLVLPVRSESSLLIQQL